MDSWPEDAKAYAKTAHFKPQELDGYIAKASTVVHPLFAHERWVGSSKADYLRLLPSLRMASIAIESVHTTHFWHAFLFGVFTSKQDLDGVLRGRFSRVYMDSNKPLPSEEEQRVLDTLRDLAENVIFVIEDDERDIFSAKCEPLVNGKAPESSTGLRSRIKINSTVCDMLKRPDLDMKARRRRWFELGVNLVHETAHALHLATYGPLHEMFFEDDIFAEMGHAITNWVFGGEVHKRDWNTSEEALYLGKVPHSSIIRRYHAMGYQYAVSAPVPQKGSFWRLSDDQIEAALIYFFLEIEPGMRLVLGPNGLEVTMVN